MLILSLSPTPDGKYEFSYSAMSKVPEASGCYVITMYDGKILYIGQSTNICKRMEQHLDKGDKNNTPWGKSFWLYYKLCPTHELSNLENGWVNQYTIKEGKLPFFNKVHPPI
ncbi:MAG: GIY-YIG nuclease family protein [Gammaproteobacteria bacterium WSBS_2016_MAG_OTU1]